MPLWSGELSAEGEPVRVEAAVSVCRSHHIVDVTAREHALENQAEEVAFLRSASRLIFVVDAQSLRFNANVHALDQLEQDIAALRGEQFPPLLFQVNKIHMPGRVSEEAIREALHWPGSSMYLEREAVNGAEALDAIVAVLKLGWAR
jgi:signal recognition particle receptor subunit beta